MWKRIITVRLSMYIKIDLQDGELTNDFSIVDFFNSIYKKNYIWNVSYIDFVAKKII